MCLKLLFDMNLPVRFAEHFFRKGFEARHWSSIGNPAAKDTELMEYAKNNSYTVVTYDLDFSAILAATQAEKPSVIQVRTVESHISDVLNLLEQVVTQAESELLAGAIVTLEVDRLRIRVLPLHRRLISN
jgi:predicted nuclease of predicted toxin-antitoxin system